MKYISTRGDCPEQSFSQILLGGLAPDGGLYVPEEYPKLSDADLTRLRPLSYPDLAFEILKLFIDDEDIPHKDLKTIIDKTYTAEIFQNVRDGQKAEDITPTLKLNDHLYLLSLSGGPTLAFKDIAMQLLGNLFEYVLDKNGQTLNILGATSGDTGSSAEYALRGKKNIKVFMLSPLGRMSPFQTAQMYSLQDDNIFNIALEGTFDQAQDCVKTLFNDQDFKKQYHLGAVNSINLARVLAQLVYYFKGYFAVTQNNDEKVSFAVPTGNFGNICAGHYARMMGLPIDKLILATNENDVLHTFFETGVYSPRSPENTYRTTSPSMDISRASNFERLIFDACRKPQWIGGYDDIKDPVNWAGAELPAKNLAGWARSVLKTIIGPDSPTTYFQPSEDFYSMKVIFGFLSGKSTHQNRIETIKEIYDRYKVMIDPHTTDGMYVAQQCSKNIKSIEPPIIVLETALPTKFEETMVEALPDHALEIKSSRPKHLKNLEDFPKRFKQLPADASKLKQYFIDCLT